MGQFEKTVACRDIVAAPSRAIVKGMKPEDCPNCEHRIGIPGMFHAAGNMTMHTHRTCPGCKRPLIWFNTDTEIGNHWMIDEQEERRQRRLRDRAA